MALRSFTGSGTRIKGGRGGPSLPQAERRRRRKKTNLQFRISNLAIFNLLEISNSNIGDRKSSQDVPAEVLVLHDFGEHFLDVACVNSDRLLLEIGAFKGDVVKEFLHDRMKAAGANVLRAFIHRRGEASRSEEHTSELQSPFLIS